MGSRKTLTDTEIKEGETKIEIDSLICKIIDQEQKIMKYQKIYTDLLLIYDKIEKNSSEKQINGLKEEIQKILIKTNLTTKITQKEDIYTENKKINDHINNVLKEKEAILQIIPIELYREIKKRFLYKSRNIKSHGSETVNRMNATSMVGKRNRSSSSPKKKSERNLTFIPCDTDEDCIKKKSTLRCNKKPQTKIKKGETENVRGICEELRTYVKHT